MTNFQLSLEGEGFRRSRGTVDRFASFQNSAHTFRSFEETNSSAVSQDSFFEDFYPADLILAISPSKLLVSMATCSSP